MARLALIALIALSGLCTIFAAVVTAAQAWQEHAQARWPEVTARVDSCSLERTSSNGGRKLHIRCLLSYLLGTEQNTTDVYSANVPSPEIWQYPPNQIAPLEDWVQKHPPGTRIVLRYDPTDHEKVVLASTYMPPLGGPKTPSNIKLLEVCAASFLALLAIALIWRPRPASSGAYSPMPLNR